MDWLFDHRTNCWSVQTTMTIGEYVDLIEQASDARPFCGCGWHTTAVWRDGVVWLDDQGAPRRLVIGLREVPAQESLIVVGIDMRLTPRTEPAAIDVPGVNTVTTVPSLFQFLQPLKSGSSA